MVRTPLLPGTSWHSRESLFRSDSPWWSG